MEYNIEIHIPQQVENFMNAYAQGDSNLLERIRKNILTLIPDGSFHKDMMEYETHRKQRINNLMNKAIENVRNKANNPDGEKTIVDIQSDFKQLEMDLNTVESEYWDKISQYMISWLNEQQPTE